MFLRFPISPGFLTALCVLRYLYGFEEYCRSASITFRTIHHNNPRPPPPTPANQKTAGEEPKESSQVKAESDDKGEEAESESESSSEKDETPERQLSPRVSHVLIMAAAVSPDVSPTLTPRRGGGGA